VTKEYIDSLWYKDDRGVYIFDTRPKYIRVWWDSSDPTQGCWWGRGRKLVSNYDYQNHDKHYELDLSKFKNRNQRDEALEYAQHLIDRLQKEGY
jgi:hypothetical protein